ncbi:hypothetical protein [uncultured Bacteroides sp.]|uniref:hypothetical protein n=1 Tax=uncultured Bacteroides sp. TaxID=162156 RepID=UPI0026317CC3|nr:hypothetical protein [uncultured Bacteroides sp.]
MSLLFQITNPPVGIQYLNRNARTAGEHVKKSGRKGVRSLYKCHDCGKGFIGKKYLDNE